MPPIVAAIAAVFTAIGVSAAVAYAIATLIVNLAVSAIITTLLAPKRASVGDRQAHVLRVQLGEGPRGAILGRAATAGSLINIWNDGNDNQFETAVFALADHQIDAIEGVIVNDKEYVLSSQGAQSHADFQDGESKLSIQWALGAPNQTTVTHITTEGVNAGQWTSDEATNGFKGFAYVVARYKISDRVWKAGRPSFVWIVRGAKLYDPRKDSSVAGGAGAHRWGDSSTYEWTENARVCHYNYIRGIYSFPISATVGQLMVGPGRAQEEAPASDAIADANLCDEPVDTHGANRWHFTANVDGFTADGGSLTHIAAEGQVDLVSTGGDPQLLSPSGLAVVGATSRRVRARVRRVSVAGTWAGQVHYVTGGHGFSASFVKTIPEPAGWAAGEWVEAEWDMSALTAGGSDWVDNTITQIRLDLTNSHPSTTRFDWVAIGDTEQRYRASAVIEASEKWIDVEENLAAAMAGQLVERAGTIAVDVGAWKPLGPEIVDDSFISGTEMQYQDFKSRDDLINTVHARFIDPKQLWRQASILPRFKQADIDSDGEVRDATLDLVFVTSQTQAQRCAEIGRRRGRLQRNAVFTVGPRYMLMEAGDWIRWRSQRRFSGEARTFELQGVANTEDMHVRMILSEIDGSVFDWDAAVDELEYQAAEHVQPSLPANPRQFGSLNVNGGVSGTFTGPPLTAVSPTSITITSRTWTGAGGETDTVPGGSVGSLSNSTKYWVAYDRFNDSFVASSSFTTATAWFADPTAQFLMIGNATTQTGGSLGGNIGDASGGGGGGAEPGASMPLPLYAGHGPAYTALGEGKIFADTTQGNAVRVTLNQEIRFENAGAGASAITSPTNVPYPTGVLPGNFLVLHALAAATGADVTTPSGWTLLNSVANGSGSAESFIFYKIAAGTETGNLSVTHVGTDGFHARMYRFSRGSGIEAAAATFDSSADTTATAVDVTTLDSWRMACQAIALPTNTTIGAMSGESGADYTEAVAEYSSATGAVTGTLSMQVARVGVNPTAITGGTATTGVSVVDFVHGFAIVP